MRLGGHSKSSAKTDMKKLTIIIFLLHKFGLFLPKVTTPA